MCVWVCGCVGVSQLAIEYNGTFLYPFGHILGTNSEKPVGATNLSLRSSPRQRYHFKSKYTLSPILHGALSSICVWYSALLKYIADEIDSFYIMLLGLLF